MPASSSGCRHIRVDWGVPFYVEADDCFLADELFRHAEAFEMFWHAEGMKLEYEGEVVWNGRKYLVRPEDCYGYADKNWGGFTGNALFISR